VAAAEQAIFAGVCVLVVDALAKRTRATQPRGMIRRDYVQRLIEQLGAAVAAVARRKANPEQVLTVVEAAKVHLPLVPGLLGSANTSVIVSAIGDPEALRLLGHLYRAEGQAQKELGQTVLATRAMQRSLELLQAASAAEAEAAAR
jgi:hypothetical protein